MMLLDTTFLIDLLRGKKETVNILNSKQLLLTTQVNMYEVIRGLFLKKASSSKIFKVKELFENIRVLNMDDTSIVKSAEISSELIKKGKIISDCDCFTAGIALSNGVNKIVTRNIKHFNKIKDVKVVEY